jgi:hypothetical protein
MKLIKTMYVRTWEYYIQRYVVFSPPYAHMVGSFYSSDRVFIERFYLVKASKLGYVGNHDMRIITDALEREGG